VVEQKVLGKVQAKTAKASESEMADARAEHLQRWWQFWNARSGMRVAFSKLNRFIGMSRVTKRAILCFISTKILPDGQIQTFAFDDDYSFGFLASTPHWQWFRSNCSKLTERLRYSPASVFETLPWPQSPSVAQIDAVAEAGREVRRVREAALQSIKGGLRAVYRTLELPGANPLKDAHAALDAAVLAAYGFDPAGDLLAQLLELNQTVAARIDAGNPVTSPGIPPDYPKPSRLVTDDCIQPPRL
jgi:hypothetical protein